MAKKSKTKSPPTPDEGLLKFYSAEAEALLAQYKRIDFLLGSQSNDHLHTGTLCEILLRDYFRRVLLSWMGVDKGFVYGRSIDGNNPEVSPEIDILIHNQKDFRPLFRQNDFVIVQPESVLGIIQVKKKLNPAGRNPLRKGIENVLQAKVHTLQQLIRRGGDPTTQTGKEILSAVVGFEGRAEAQTYWKFLEEARRKFPATESGYSIGADVLPHFVGSLQGRFIVKRPSSTSVVKLTCFKSNENGHNISVQTLADMSSYLIWGSEFFPHKRPSFQYPRSLKPEKEYEITISNSPGLNRN